MQMLPVEKSGLPKGLSEETLGGNLASLAMTPALKSIIDTVLTQWRSKEVFKPLAKYGIFPVRQLLFYGPPGNGKTSACQWIAQRLDVPLYRVRCEQLVEAYLGRTASNVSDVMEHLMRSPSAVVLFDEVETLFPARGGDKSSCSREMTSAMTVYWQYMDRWTQNHLFVLATNMEEQLDAALMSRIEMHLQFGPPTAAQASEVIAYWSETLHQYGSDQWAKDLYLYLDAGNEFASFRDLWQQIQRRVNAFVTDSILKG
jgi:ATP-dependent 26S proteasome regulatory subunit